jgi:hypothetical protein
MINAKNNQNSYKSSNSSESIDLTNNLETNSNDSINSNNSSKKIKKTRNRLTKKQQFSKERDEIINKLNGIIGIDDKKNSVYLYDLEHNEEIEKFIKVNVDIIKNIFKTGNFGYFSNDISRGKDNPIGLIRSLYTDCDYEITSKLKVNTFDGIKKQYTMLFFNKKK